MQGSPEPYVVQGAIRILFIEVSQHELQEGDDGDPRRLGPKNSRTQVDRLETYCLSLPGLFIGKTSLGTDEDQNLGRMGHGLTQASSLFFLPKKDLRCLPPIEGEHFFEGMEGMNFGDGSPAALFRRFRRDLFPASPAGSGLPLSPPGDDMG